MSDCQACETGYLCTKCDKRYCIRHISRTRHGCDKQRAAPPGTLTADLAEQIKQIREQTAQQIEQSIGQLSAGLMENPAEECITSIRTTLNELQQYVIQMNAEYINQIEQLRSSNKMLVEHVDRLAVALQKMNDRQNSIDTVVHGMLDRIECWATVRQDIQQAASERPTFKEEIQQAAQDVQSKPPPKKNGKGRPPFRV